jgi:hypothetical protein
MTKNEMKLIAGFMQASLAADKFHLWVAKALLSPEPISERVRQQLLDALAKRESDHEKIEALFAALKKLYDD